MCAIIDANAADQIFGSNRPEAGVKFFEWINLETGRLVAGDKLLKELNRTSARTWAQEALKEGKIRRFDKSKVKAKTEELQNAGSCKSDDEHVIALAQISGARLLYSNDTELHDDFGTKNLIDNPRGKIYSTLLKARQGKGKRYSMRPDERFRDSHRNLLKRKDLCRSGK